MPRYRYRIKQRVFRNTDFSRHQDFRTLEKRYAAHRKSTGILRFLLILLALIVLIGILVFIASADQGNVKDPTNTSYPELKFRSVPIKLSL